MLFKKKAPPKRAESSKIITNFRLFFIIFPAKKFLGMVLSKLDFPTAFCKSNFTLKNYLDGFGSAIETIKNAPT